MTLVIKTRKMIQLTHTKPCSFLSSGQDQLLYILDMLADIVTGKNLRTSESQLLVDTNMDQPLMCNSVMFLYCSMQKYHTLLCSAIFLEYCMCMGMKNVTISSGNGQNWCIPSQPLETCLLSKLSLLPHFICM